MGWLFDPTSTRGAGWNTYTPDLYRDKTIFRIHAWYFYWLGLGVVLPVVVCGLAHHSFSGALLGLLWGGAVRIFLLNHAIWAINSVTHRWGKRDFHTPDQSTNNIWLSLPTLGEAWHNNHHAFPSSAFAGFYWWQLDPGGWIIELMKRTGLAWDVKRPTREHLKRKLIEPA
jgi:stearoyl-CoA desaturase (delta-9 desaturase)